MECECPAAGWCERYKQMMVGRLHDICQGKNVDQATRQKYQDRWNGDEAVLRKTALVRPANRFDSGIGTRLERIIHEKTGIKPCPYCRSQIKRLNTMSPEQATLEIDKIVSGIIKNKWYVRVVDILMPGIATGVIEGWVREAIGNDTQVP